MGNDWPGLTGGEGGMVVEVDIGVLIDRKSGVGDRLAVGVRATHDDPNGTPRQHPDNRRWR